MAFGSRLISLTRAGALASLICLTLVLVILGVIFTRSGSAFWFVAAFVGVPLWLAYAIFERGLRRAA